MNIYETKAFSTIIAGNTYPGRGIIIGTSNDSRSAFALYFIMGRSTNSRNRVFSLDGNNNNLQTLPADPALVSDPSLIIYHPVKWIDNKLIITNGDQTDTIYNTIKSGGTFETALQSRTFEPDPPHLTPRISSILTFENGTFTYKMSILKSSDAAGSAANRFTYSISPTPGVGHFIHTYECDGDPLPTFCGEPKRIKIGGDITSLMNEVWNSLDENNKISLWGQYISLDLPQPKNGGYIINKYEAK